MQLHQLTAAISAVVDASKQIRREYAVERLLHYVQVEDRGELEIADISTAFDRNSVQMHTTKEVKRMTSDGGD